MRKVDILSGWLNLPFFCLAAKWQLDSRLFAKVDGLDLAFLEDADRMKTNEEKRGMLLELLHFKDCKTLDEYCFALEMEFTR